MLSISHGNSLKDLHYQLRAKLVEEIIHRNKTHVFKDRLHAGKHLATKLKSRRKELNFFAIPSGGIPVCHAISDAIGISFDITLVRKLQIPWNTEAGFGALSWDGEVVLNDELVSRLGVTKDMIDRVARETLHDLDQRLKKLRGNRPFSDLEGKKIVIVDDGLASGYTMLAAVGSARKRGVEKITVAIPTASIASIELLSQHVEEIVCINVRDSPFFAVADAYIIWHDLSDEEAMRYLYKHKKS